MSPQPKRTGLDDLRVYLGLFVGQALAAELGGVALAMSGQPGYMPLALSLMLMFLYLMAAPVVLLLLIGASTFDLSKPVRAAATAAMYFAFGSIVLWGESLEPWRLITVAWLTVAPTLLVWLWGRAPARVLPPVRPEAFVSLHERLRRADAVKRASDPKA